MNYSDNYESYFNQPRSSEQQRNEDNQEMDLARNRMMWGDARTFSEAFKQNNSKPHVIRKFDNYHYGW